MDRKVEQQLPRKLRGRHLYCRVCILVPQSMRHNLEQPFQVAGDNSAGRTRNRVRQSRDQNPNMPDMSVQPQMQRLEI